MSNFVFFHNPDEENGYLSNWYLSDFAVNGRRFTSVEQYMMYSKAMTFQDIAIAQRIMFTYDVAEIKSLGRKVHNYVDEVWASQRYDIVRTGVYYKFVYNDKLRYELLRNTGKIFAECAVGDMIWGIGLSMIDSNRFDMSKWRGQNLLGKCINEVVSMF